MKKYFFIVLIIPFISCQPRGNDQKEVTLNDSLTNQFQNIYDNGNLHGFSISLMNEKEAIYQQAFGYSDVANGKKYKLTTRQPIASISKTLVGISLLKAQELGKLNLDDPINKYLPFSINNPFYPDIEITIRQLANHTSTILDTDLYDESSYFLKNDKHLKSSSPIKIYEYFNSPREAVPIKDFIKNMLYTEKDNCCRDVFLNEKPGTTYQYSNGATVLAAVILEIATNQSFQEFTAKYIFKPLEMNQSSWNTDSTNTKLYHDGDTIYADYLGLDYPAGGLVTNSKDLSKYLQELINGYSGNGNVLSNRSYLELFNKSFADKFSKESFPEDENVFMNIKYDKGVYMGIAPQGYIGHTGSDPGTTTFMFFNKNTNKGFALIINRTIWWQYEEALKDLWTIMDILEHQTSLVK
ncbi:serine hydrolase domain-containing protein [Marivirga salinae]|uniref:Serine hydrolase domain-containing protein n=1 Tax=Marivirga salinarum TaxID=3059078 RepID=A0AA49JGL9_9BACT|nr:serine hydrolase domain-containing protein [Marivirga sp. BDSF4-3]WKK74712.2 serine hydrolase domain-containing protein [Marivirga sp. BDSF4-3]